MFELHVVVAGIVMFNIIELIVEIVPNYPTICSRGTSNTSTSISTFWQPPMGHQMMLAQLQNCSLPNAATMMKMTRKDHPCVSLSNILG
jgi:hypothetical protein